MCHLLCVTKLFYVLIISNPYNKNYTKTSRKSENLFRFTSLQIHPRKFKALRPPQTDGGRDSGNRQNDSSRTSPAGRRNLQAEASRTLGETNGQQERQHEDGKRSFDQVRKNHFFFFKSNRLKVLTM